MSSMELFGLCETWPLWQEARHFELGHILNCTITDALAPREVGAIGAHHAGLWECDLADQSLVWSGGVYDLFGLERSVPLRREQILAFYSEDSAAKLQRLRSHAIANGFGFTLDAEIRAAAVGQTRRMRLIAAPVLSERVAVRLHGLKLAI